MSNQLAGSDSVIPSSIKSLVLAKDVRKRTFLCVFVHIRVWEGACELHSLLFLNVWVGRRLCLYLSMCVNVLGKPSIYVTRPKMLSFNCV